MVVEARRDGKKWQDGQDEDRLYGLAALRRWAVLVC